MANAMIDSSELEYLKSCRNKLRDIADVLKEAKNEKEEESSSKKKLQEIKKIIKG